MPDTSNTLATPTMREKSIVILGVFVADTTYPGFPG